MRVEVDGVGIDGNLVKLDKQGGEYQVLVWMGK